MAKELNFQKYLIKCLNDRGCYCIINDPSYENGIPDLSVTYMGRFIMLELKMGDEPLRAEQKRFIKIHGYKIAIFVIRKHFNFFELIGEKTSYTYPCISYLVDAIICCLKNTDKGFKGYN